MTANSDGSASKEELLKNLQSTLEHFFYKIKAYHREETESLAEGQLFLLLLLKQKNICKASELAAQIGITSGAVTGMTDKLVSMGLIHRERSEEDRRVVLLSLTEEGTKTLDKIRAHRFQRMSELFLQLEKGELSNMLDVFRKLNTILENGGRS